MKWLRIGNENALLGRVTLALCRIAEYQIETAEALETGVPCWQYLTGCRFGLPSQITVP